MVEVYKQSPVDPWPEDAVDLYRDGQRHDLVEAFYIARGLPSDQPQARAEAVLTYLSLPSDDRKVIKVWGEAKGVVEGMNLVERLLRRYEESLSRELRN